MLVISDRSGSVRQTSQAEQQSPGGRFAESGRVRLIVGSTEKCVWSIPVTVVEARVGDAGVSGRVREGVLAPSS